ncbi:MAG: imidazole glycerol phosphate synthase subunit HisF [Candidatus Lokiarchaeota archaeon]|nr:imidazole glycerol phosphate synthase subunit HisF [Candidatus Lokiarchaeota archaeon]
MTDYKKIVPCLDTKEGKLVKGIKFINLREIGDPADFAVKYEKDGADLIILLDISASVEGRDTLLNVVKRTAEKLSTPFAVGGGIKNIKNIETLLKAGCDKISINTAAIKDPSFVKEAVNKFGGDKIVIAIDAMRYYVHGKVPEDKHVYETVEGPCWGNVVIYGGTKVTDIDLIDWSIQMSELGISDILFTSKDADGTTSGYDIPLTRAITENVKTPVIASGGCGHPYHILEVLTEGKADAALAASIFHYDQYSVKEVKNYLKGRGILVK